MAVTVENRMTPTLRRIRAGLPDVIAALSRDNANTILAASQALVPVDTGDLRGSGRVVARPKGASLLVYGGVVGPSRGRLIEYAGVVHYRADVTHRRGQAQFVGQPLREQRIVRRTATARAMRKWLVTHAKGR